MTIGMSMMVMMAMTMVYNDGDDGGVYMNDWDNPEKSKWVNFDDLVIDAKPKIDLSKW